MAKNIFELALESTDCTIPLELTVLEAAQSNVNQDNDFHVILDETESEIKETRNDVNKEAEAILALESITNYVSRVLATESLDKNTIVFANLAIESIYEKAKISTDALTFSMENYKADPQAELNHALEGIREKISSLFSSLKDQIVKLSLQIVDTIRNSRNALLQLKAKLAKVELMLSQTNLKEPKFPLIKPESWCKYLCYLDSGFAKGLKGVIPDVNWLVDEHRKLTSKTTGKFIDWFKEHSTETNNDFLFKSLKVSKDDFLLPGMSEFNRSIDTQSPIGNNMFYRSRELPGGLAYFVQTETSPKMGVSAVTVLNNFSCQLSPFDPASYKLQKMKLYSLAGISFGAWLALVNPAVGVGVIAASTIAKYKNNKVDNTGKAVKLDNKLMFETLSLDEIKHVISEVKTSLAKLDQWTNDVLNKTWKNDELNHAIDKIVTLDRVEVHNGISVRYMRNYCYGLLNLMTENSVGIHTYAYKVLNASLSFSEKSLKQYV